MASNGPFLAAEYFVIVFTPLNIASPKKALFATIAKKPDNLKGVSGFAVRSLYDITKGQMNIRDLAQYMTQRIYVSWKNLSDKYIQRIYFRFGDLEYGKRAKTFTAKKKGILEKNESINYFD